jgi:hypothetical protein
MINNRFSRSLSVEAYMRYMIGIMFVTLSLSVICVAQQKDVVNPSPQPASPGIHPTAELLMRSVVQTPAPKSDEKSESKPVVTSPPVSSIPQMRSSVVVLNGDTYVVIGSVLVPLSGGGATGCFDVDGEQTRSKLEKAQAQWASLQNKK